MQTLSEISEILLTMSPGKLKKRVTVVGEDPFMTNLVLLVTKKKEMLLHYPTLLKDRHKVNLTYCLSFNFSR